MLLVQNISKEYSGGIVALKDVCFDVSDGEFCYLIGHSGAGKSTLIRLILRDEVPTAGKISFNNVDVSALPDDYLGAYRQQIGVVFQDYKLIPTKTVFDNVAFAMEVLGKSPSEITDAVEHALESVDLKDRNTLYPKQLSGGEQQRVAIARAIVNEPILLITDEPTGNLDKKTAMDIVALLKQINSRGTTVVTATHDIEIMKAADEHVIELKDGQIVKDEFI